MIKIRKNCKEIERKSFGAKTGQKQGSARFRSLCEIGTLLRNQFAASGPSLRKFSQLRNHFWHTSAILQHSDRHFAAAKRLRTTKAWKIPFFAGKAPFRRGFRSCEATFWHTSAISQHSNPHFAAAKRLRSIKTPNFAAKALFRRVFRDCETTFWHTSAILQPRTLILELRNHFWATKWLRNDLQASKWLRNHLQASKWPSNCEIDLQNGGRFAKTPCKANGSC